MLPFPDGRARRVLVLSFLVLPALAFSALAQQARPKKAAAHKKSQSPEPSATPDANAELPLPIGHEAKGLAFPDIDANGHVRGRFVAGSARRIDQNHMEFRDLRITTFNEGNETDLQVEMSQGVLDVDTRVLSSPTLTKVKRADFEIVGDTARFDTAARQGTLTGNVHMVITDAKKLSGPKPQ